MQCIMFLQDGAQAYARMQAHSQIKLAVDLWLAMEISFIVMEQLSFKYSFSLLYAFVQRWLPGSSNHSGHRHSHMRRHLEKKKHEGTTLCA